MILHAQPLFGSSCKIADRVALSESIVVCHGDCLDLLKSVPNGALQLVVTPSLVN